MDCEFNCSSCTHVVATGRFTLVLSQIQFVSIYPSEIHSCITKFSRGWISLPSGLRLCNLVMIIYDSVKIWKQLLKIGPYYYIFNFPVVILFKKMPIFSFELWEWVTTQFYWLKMGHGSNIKIVSDHAPLVYNDILNSCRCIVLLLPN